MKIKMNLKSSIFMLVIGATMLFLVNMSLATNTAKIIVETANLREKASSEAKILEQISQGEEVEVLKQEGDWYQVTYKKITGYLRNDLLSVEKKEENTTIENTSENTSENIENTSENTSENIENTPENEVEEKQTEIPENETVETNSEPKQEFKGTYQVLGDTKAKITPLITSMEIIELKKDEKIEVDRQVNGWAHMVKDSKQGWVRIEKIQKVQEGQPVNANPETTPKKEETTKKTRYVNSQTVNVREKADKSSALVAQLSMNKQVTVLAEEKGWSQIEVDGKKGYISSSLLSKTKQQSSRGSDSARKAVNKEEEPTTQTSTNTNQETQNNTSTTANKGPEVVAYAKTFLGCKYVYGGTTPNGFDCSGFTSYVYRHFGISLNRTAVAQYRNGRSVTSLQIGDLVMFGKSGINHVGIYIGGNQFIHAANPSRGVTIDSLSSGYYKTNYVGARRIF